MRLHKWKYWQVHCFMWTAVEFAQFSLKDWPSRNLCAVMSPEEVDLVIRRLISLGAPKETWKNPKKHHVQCIETKGSYLVFGQSCSQGFCLGCPHVLMAVECHAGACDGVDCAGPILWESPGFQVSYPLWHQDQELWYQTWEKKTRKKRSEVSISTEKPNGHQWSQRLCVSQLYFMFIIYLPYIYICL